MYICYQGKLAVYVADSREQLEAVCGIEFDSIEEYEGRAELVDGVILFDSDIDVAKMKALEEQYTSQVQAMLDEAAKALGYDSCLSVCSYIDTGVEKFDKEGVQFRRWRSAIWARGYELLDEVKAGVRPVPTPEELPDLMPKLEEFAEVMHEEADNSEQPEQVVDSEA